MTDSYKTIEGTSEAEYEEKKSRFIAQVAHVESEAEALGFLENIRSAHPMARHNVYAYVLREGNRVRYSDDGEPARTSGMPTLSVIEHDNLKDVICVTTRYFGGTLLGTGGLVRAYTKAAQDAFAQAKQITYAPCKDFQITLDYAHYDSVIHWIDAQKIDVIDSQFSENVAITIRVLLEDAEAVKAALTELTHGNAQIIEGSEGFRPLALAPEDSQQ